MKVIGGGRLADGIAVTGAVKGDLVAHMRDVLHSSVWAFGDSPLDLDMLCKADHAVVVVGEEGKRSRSMDTKLATAIAENGLRACQMLFPSTTLPRLDITQLPLLDFDGHFDVLIFSRSLRVYHATDRSATKLLTAPTRDSALAGPALRDAHSPIGRYLATEYLTSPMVIGLEAYPMTSVQKASIEGHRLLDEAKTTIIPLMRGGEPMAFGVGETFPLAMFLHAKKVTDVEAVHLEGESTVILVDSVVNTGKSVAEFILHIRKPQPAIRFVVVASVVQKGVVQGRSKFRLALEGVRQFTLVALRLSENRFTGKGTTDTGNRLFDTTYLPDKKDDEESESGFDHLWRGLRPAA